MSIDQAVLDERWYYTVELEPGRITNGYSFKNIAPARKVLESIDVKHHTAIDLSTMEGMFSTLMAKRGAVVTATDTIDCSKRVDLLKAAHGVNFRYLPNTPLENQPEFMFKNQTSRSFSPLKALGSEQRSPWGYDIVFSSGVMYHVASPIQYIIQLRKLVKLGGMVVIETACAINDEIELHHDYRKDEFIFGGKCSWFISTAALDLFLRVAFLRPLGFCYIYSAGKADLEIIRLGIVAEAVEERPFEPEFFERVEKGEIVRNFDLQSLYEAAQLTGSVANPVAYKKDVLTPIGSKLLAEDIRKTPVLDYNEKDLQLHLADQ